MPILINETAADFGTADLPMLVSGRDKSGASFYTISIAADLYNSKKKILFFCAFPMGVAGVRAGKTGRDKSPFQSRYEPGHPAADARGFVQRPNVDMLVESMDMREAQRSYEANVSIISATRRMIARTLDILKI